MQEKYLPIGSVVTLKEATKKVMIIGYCGVDTGNNDQIYDYSACLYPEGLLSSEQILLFNHSQIKEINYVGYTDEEQKKFVANLKEIVVKQDINKG